MPRIHRYQIRRHVIDGVSDISAAVEAAAAIRRRNRLVECDHESSSNRVQLRRSALRRRDSDQSCDRVSGHARRKRTADGFCRSLGKVGRARYAGRQLLGSGCIDQRDRHRNRLPQYGDNATGSRGVLFGTATSDWFGWDVNDTPAIIESNSTRVLGNVARAEQVTGWQIQSGAWRIYQDGINTASSAAAGTPGAVDKIIGLAAGTSAYRNRMYAAYLWTRILSSSEHHELAVAPFSLFKPLQRRVYFIPAAAPLTVNLDVAGSITIAGQSVSTGLNVNLGAGSVTIGGEASTLALSANQFVSIDEAGSVTIQGQDADILLRGDIDVELDAGSITIAGQDCALTLTTPQEGGPFRKLERKRRKLRPEDLPPMEVEVDFLQPWQTCAATVEVIDELAIEAEQEGALLNSNAESSDEVTIEVQQEVAALLASFAAVPLKSAAPRAMPKTETARVRVALNQPAHRLNATVEVA